MHLEYLYPCDIAIIDYVLDKALAIAILPWIISASLSRGNFRKFNVFIAASAFKHVLSEFKQKPKNYGS